MGVTAAGCGVTGTGRDDAEACFFSLPVAVVPLADGDTVCEVAADGNVAGGDEENVVVTAGNGGTGAACAAIAVCV